MASANEQTVEPKLVLDKALGEIIGHAPNYRGMMNPDRKDHDVLAGKVLTIVNQNAAILSATQEERNALYARLLNTYNSTANEQDRLASIYALDVFMRAVDHTNATSGPALEAFADRNAYLAWSRDNQAYARDPAAWHEANSNTAATSSKKTPPAAPAAGATAPSQSTNKQPLDRALDEIIGPGPNYEGMMNPEHKAAHSKIATRAIEIVNSFKDIVKISQSEREDIYEHLLAEWNSKDKAIEEKLAYRYALDVFMREVEYIIGADNNKSVVPFENREEYLKWSKDNEASVNNIATWRTPPAAPAAVAIPPAPSGSDSEPYGPYRGQKYAASNTPRGEVRAAQLLLESLGAEYTTGVGNTLRYGTGQHDASAMDGIVGKMTDAAIRKFQGENELAVTGALDEVTMNKLREVVAARAAAAAAAAGQSQSSDVSQSKTTDGAGTTTDTTTPPDLKTQLATELATVSGLSDAVVDYRVALFAPEDKDVLKAFLAKFVDKETGKSSLTPEQIATISVKNGVISSQLIGQVETALGLTSDNKMDARLEAALNNATIKSAVVAAFTGTAVSGGATTDVAAPSGTPGGSGTAQAR